MQGQCKHFSSCSEQQAQGKKLKAVGLEQHDKCPPCVVFKSMQANLALAWCCLLLCAWSERGFLQVGA